MRRAFATVMLGLGLIVSSNPAQAQGQGKRPITVKDMLALPTYGGYQLSSDAKQVLFTRTDRDPKDYTAISHIWLYDLTSQRTVQLTSNPKGESGPRWLPDGRVAFLSNRDTKNAWWAISPSGGEAVKMFDDDAAPTNGSFAPDFKRIAFTEQSDRPDKKEWEERTKKKDDGYFFEKKLQYSHVWVYDAASKKKTQITSGTFDQQGPSWSPDGKWIAFTSNLTGTNARDFNWSDNSDVFVVSADGGEPRKITTNEGPDNGPVWSPDGAWIAYSSSDRKNNNANQMDVKLVPASGGTPMNLTVDLDYSISGIEWSKDGAYIYFTAAEGLTSRLYKVRATGGKPAPVAFGDGYVFGDFSASGDGNTWVVTGSTLAEPSVVYLTGADGKAPRRIFADHDRISDFATAKSEAITWKGADNWDIEGVLTYPVGYETGKKYPLILQVHGGPHGRFSASFNQGAQVWAARGYAVLQGNPRGSSGRTFAFSNANVNDWGGKDFQDIMKGVDHVIALGVANPDQMAVMGGSYGGFMTFWTVTQTNRFKAAIGHAGISDWYSFFGQTDIPNLLEFGFGGLPANSKQTYERWSPIEYAAKVTTPLLITHGDEDTRVPIAQAEEYYRLLKKLGKQVEFLRFPREGHGITEPLHRITLDQEQEKWFAEFVLKKPMRPVSSSQ